MTGRWAAPPRPRRSQRQSRPVAPPCSQGHATRRHEGPGPETRPLTPRTTSPSVTTGREYRSTAAAPAAAGHARWTRPRPMLDATPAGAVAAESPEPADPDPDGGSVLSCSLRPLHGQIPGTGGPHIGVDQACRCRHSRQRSHDDAGDKQPGDRCRHVQVARQGIAGAVKRKRVVLSCPSTTPSTSLSGAAVPARAWR